MTFFEKILKKNSDFCENHSEWLHRIFDIHRGLYFRLFNDSLIRVQNFRENIFLFGKFFSLNFHLEFPSTKIAPVAPNAEFDLLDVAGSKEDVRFLLSTVIDGSKFHEFKEMFGTGLVCGFARIEGHMIGIVANNGILDVNSALKGTHFVHMATEREIPLIFLQNSSFHDDFEPEEMSQKSIEESSNTLRARASLIAAVSVSKVKKNKVSFYRPFVLKIFYIDNLEKCLQRKHI